MTSETVLAYLGLGSNLGNRANEIYTAVESLDAHPQIDVIEVSALFETAPWYIVEQPRFLNAALALRTSLSAELLLAAMQSIESDQKREREITNGPRTIDIDLLTFGDLQQQTKTLIVPHPNLHERPFVLVPLAEIAPTLQIPGRARVIDHLAALAFGGEISPYEETPDKE